MKKKTIPDFFPLLSCHLLFWTTPFFQNPLWIIHAPDQITNEPSRPLLKDTRKIDNYGFPASEKKMPWLNVDINFDFSSTLSAFLRNTEIATWYVMFALGEGGSGMQFKSIAVFPTLNQIK